MLDALTLAISGLAAARLTTLIVSDGITEPIRHRLFLLSPPLVDVDGGPSIYRSFDRRGNQVPELTRKPGFAGQLLSCHYCVAVWAATSIYAGLQVVPTATLSVATVAAIAQIAELAIKASR